MSFKTGTIVKSRYSSNHFTVISSTEWFSHQTHKSTAAPTNTDNYDQVHPKTREPKAGDVVKHTQGYIYTITHDDKFFSHETQKVVNGIPAKNHINSFPGTYTYLTD